MDRIFAFVDEKKAFHFARYSMALFLVWFGFMNFTQVGEQIMMGWLRSHAFLSGLAGHGDQPANVLGILQILFGVTLLVPRGKLPTIGAMGAALLALGSLTLMVFAPVWDDQLGGFPAIGRGQGIIKYVAIFGVAMFLAASFWGGGKEPRCEKRKALALNIIVFGIVLVMLWIGGMKFTLPEAQGIDPLLKTSPLFSWIPMIFDLQEASIFIGVIEIVAVLALLGFYFNRTLFLIGAGLCTITFLGTLSFMVTLPGWAGDLGGFPYLSGGGHFLLKDLILLAGTGLLVAHSNAHKT